MTSRSCSTRSSLFCTGSGRSLTSSEDSAAVGLLEPAGLRAEGAGGAPFSWPNSSASTSDSEKAPQLTTRRDRYCARCGCAGGAR